MEDNSFKITYYVTKARGMIGFDPVWDQSKRFELFDDARVEYAGIALEDIAEESESLDWIETGDASFVANKYTENDIPYKELIAVISAGRHDIIVSLAVDDGEYVITPPESEIDAYLSIIERLVGMTG